MTILIYDLLNRLHYSIIWLHWPLEIFVFRNSPQWARASSFTRFLDHTQRRTTVGRTRFERAISSSQRPLPDNTQHWQRSQQTNIHAPCGIRTHNLSRRAAADLRLKPRGHWDRQNFNYLLKYVVNSLCDATLYSPSFIYIVASIPTYSFIDIWPHFWPCGFSVRSLRGYIIRYIFTYIVACIFVVLLNPLVTVLFS